MVAHHRIGMLTPSSNTALEPITIGICQRLFPHVSVHFSRFRVTRISLEADSLNQFEQEPMLFASELLADTMPGAIIWNGTSGGWLGLDVDRNLCDAIEQKTSVPASTATLAQIEAMARFGFLRYALATPYIEPINQAIVRTLSTAGLECVFVAGMDITTNFQFNEVPLARIKEHLSAAKHPRAEAILVICTNFPSAYVVEELEKTLGLPIIDSTIAAVWKGLRMVGWTDPIGGWGQLMRDAFSES